MGAARPAAARVGPVAVDPVVASGAVGVRRRAAAGRLVARLAAVPVPVGARARVPGVNAGAAAADVEAVAEYPVAAGERVGRMRAATGAVALVVGAGIAVVRARAEARLVLAGAGAAVAVQPVALVALLAGVDDALPAGVPD